MHEGYWSVNSLGIVVYENVFKIRMHSSRMRTVRSSSRLLGGGMSASVHAGIHTHTWPGPGHPPGLGLEAPLARPSNLPLGIAWRPPQPDPLTSPGYGPGDLPPPLWTDRRV